MLWDNRDCWAALALVWDRPSGRPRPHSGHWGAFVAQRTSSLAHTGLRLSSYLDIMAPSPLTLKITVVLLQKKWAGSALHFPDVGGTPCSVTTGLLKVQRWTQASPQEARSRTSPTDRVIGSASRLLLSRQTFLLASRTAWLHSPAAAILGLPTFLPWRL